MHKENGQERGIHGLTRRDFVRYSLITAVAALTIGCERRPQYPPEVTKYYPEIAGTNLALTSQHTIAGRRQSLSVYNYSQYEFEERVADNILGYYEDLTDLIDRGEPTFASKFPFYFGDQKVKGIPIPVHNLGDFPKQNTFVLIPKGTEAPKVTENNMAGTILDFEDQGAFSYLRLAEVANDDKFRTTERAATGNFAIELYNQMFMVGTLDSENRALPDYVMKAQEIVSNSIGRGVASATLGMPYQEYKDYIERRRNILKRPGESELFGYNYFVMPEQDYRSIPSTALSLVKLR